MIKNLVKNIKPRAFKNKSLKINNLTKRSFNTIIPNNEQNESETNNTDSNKPATTFKLNEQVTRFKKIYKEKFDFDKKEESKNNFN
jgi:hypothetical protein